MTAARGTTLTRRYARQVAGLAALLLACAALLEGVFGYRQARGQMAARQAVLARAAATEIEQYLDNVAAGLRQVQALPWGHADFGAERRREELHRLLALTPALVDLQDVDAAGRETLFVSRSDLDRRAPGGVAATADGPVRPGFGAPRFDAQGVPNVVLSLPLGRGPAGALTRATINLRFLAEVVARPRGEDDSHVYVVDALGHLIAHPEPTLVLKQLDVSAHPPVAQARQALAASAAVASDGPGLTGRAAVTTGLPLGTTGWTLHVEQSRDRALQPALATLQRMSLLLAGGVGLALLVGWLAARRMAAPISRLREATARLAAGDWGEPPAVHTGDEIEGLADDFGAMSRQLQESYRELEGKVAARTAELSERRDEAERANAAKTRFLAAASHDLRQPMHAIGLLLGVLRTRLAESDTQALADKAQQAVRTMEGLFGALLDVSRLDAGGVTPRPETVRLPDTLERAERAYAPLAAAKGLRLRTRSLAMTVHADAALLERIIGNLCANAIRYCERGGVLVAWRLRQGRAVLRVYDTGVGIAPEQQSAIFEEFVRLNPKTGVGDEGLGLGLSIVRRSAELLGAQVTVASRPGRGSRFDLTLSAEASAAVLHDPVRTRPQVAVSLEGLFVLAADDDPNNLQATAALLGQAGCLVATASDVESALQEAARHLRSPDVLLTDLRFGGPRPVAPDQADGYALIERLREHCGEAVPAIVLTADTDATAHGLAGVQVLHKPVGPERLVEALAAVARR